MCDSACSTCRGDCGHHAAGDSKPEKDSCQSCPNRQRCHGKATVITQDTVLRLIRDAVMEVVKERGL